MEAVDLPIHRYKVWSCPARSWPEAERPVLGNVVLQENGKTGMKMSPSSVKVDNTKSFDIQKRTMETVFNKMFSSQGTWELAGPGCSHQLNLCSFPHLFAMFSSHTVLFTQGVFWRSSKGQVINLPLFISFSCRSLQVCRHFLYYKLLQKEMLGETVSVFEG